jgi:hypothetical protein
MPKGETRKSCSNPGCKRKGWWIEADENGEPVFCFRTRHDGAKHVEKFTEEQLFAELKKGRS